MEDVDLTNVFPRHSGAILRNIGSQLKAFRSIHHQHADAGDLDCSHFLHCIKLETLSIWWSSFKSSESSDLHLSAIPATDFLPALKELYLIDSCFGEWSRLLEIHRPLLTHLSLQCSHFGIPVASSFHWHDLPMLWPNLQYLNLGCNKGLSLDTLRHQIIPQLLHLKYLSFPVPSVELNPSIEEVQMAEQFKAEIKIRFPQVKIEFCQTSIVPCLFMPQA